ncbi:MAG: toll/interleukin-1 receptor domain-containing protein [Mesorhizobium sp.]
MDETSGGHSSAYQVFISYAREDHEAASDIYQWLRAAGLEVWMDTKRLKPGQNWNFEINIALQNSSFVVVILSKNSVDKRGYAQREIRTALEKAEEKLIDDVFIIPILLDENVSVPHQLRSVQYISAQGPGYENSVVDSINSQIEKLGGERKQTQEEKDVY